MAEPGWNFATFSIYINQRFDDNQMALGAALASAEKAVDKAERAQQLRNESQNEFRRSLSDLSGLMWTTKEGTTAVDGVRRELSLAIGNIDTKVDALAENKNVSLDAVRQVLDSRVGKLETANANIQGRIWAVSGLFAVLTLAVSVVSILLSHPSGSVQPVSQYVPAPTAVPAPVTVPSAAAK